MKRRVIQIANSTQLVSLPIQWARKLNIKKGDELEVSPEGNKLIISADKRPETKNVSLDVTGLDRTSILYVIRSLYRRGYDQMDLTFRNPLTIHFQTGQKIKVSNIIYDEVSRLTGLELIKQTDNFCSLKCISEASPQEFDSITRRIFLLLHDLYTEFVRAAENNDRVSLETVEQKHFTISKFISYCIRLLNKYGHPDHAKVPFLHHILAILDRITDVIKYSARDLLSYKKGLHQDTKQMLTSIAQSFDLYQKFFFDFHFDLMRKLNENRDHCKRDIEQLADRIPQQEMYLLQKMEQTLDLYLDIMEARVAMTDFPK